MAFPDLCERDQRNLKRVEVWWTIWVCALAISFALSPSGVFAVDLVLNGLPLIASIFAGYVYVVFVRNADDLMRQIHVEALAVGFGTGIAGGLALLALSRLSVNVEESGALIWLGLIAGYVVGLFLALRRYSEK